MMKTYKEFLFESKTKEIICYHISDDLDLNRQEYFLSWKKDDPIHTKNPNYIGPPTMYNTNFTEVGESRKLDEILKIVETESGEIIYDKLNPN